MVHSGSIHSLDHFKTQLMWLMGLICGYRVIFRCLHMLKPTPFPHSEINCKCLGHHKVRASISEAPICLHTSSFSFALTPYWFSLKHGLFKQAFLVSNINGFSWNVVYFGGNYVTVFPTLTLPKSYRIWKFERHGNIIWME